MCCYSDALLVVMLTDVNDNDPVFAGNNRNDNGSFIVELLEVCLSHTLVLFLSLDDRIPANVP